MSIPPSLLNTVGSWHGQSQLFLPDLPVGVSEVTATIEPTVGGTFLSIRYTWSEDGEPHEGLLLVGSAQTLFTDSWHLRDAFMICTPREDGSVFGTYSVGEGPDWGWRTAIEPSGETLRIAMYNVPPPAFGDEELGFELLLVQSSHHGVS